MSACFGRDKSKGGRTDFDAEAQDIFRKLNLPPTGGHNEGARYRAMDPVWRHPRTGGTIFVGNVEAASNLSLLEDRKITHVVNCTDSMPLYHEKTGLIKYHRFDIAGWWRSVGTSGGNEAVRAFTTPVFNFIGDALEKGENVMVHCLAGAHRAGTTGCACLMHFGGLEVEAAISAAKKCRPIIDPIGGLPQLLAKISEAYKEKPPRTLYPAGHFE